MERGSSDVGSRLAGVEGLRALAASSILIHHVWLYGTSSGERVDLGLLSRYVLPYLPAGVGLFFTLSGFLLYRPFAAAVLRGSSRPDLRRYLRNRALRIFPAYWTILVVVGVMLPAALVRPSPSKLEVGRLITDSGLLLQNVLLIQHYFPRSVLTGIQPTWSLAVEVVFYLVLPALGWLGAACATRTTSPRGRTVSALVPIAVVGVIGFSHKLALLFSPLGAGSRTGWSGDWFSVAVRSFWGQADLFLFGMALAVIWVSVADAGLVLPRSWRRWTAATASLITVVTVVLAERSIPVPHDTLLALASALLLALIVLPQAQKSASNSSALCRLLGARSFTAAGAASYSLFLWHEPVVRWLGSQGLTFDGVGGFWINLVLVAAVSGALSAGTYHWVEQPALRRKSLPAREVVDPLRGPAGAGRHGHGIALGEMGRALGDGLHKEEASSGSANELSHSRASATHPG